MSERINARLSRPLAEFVGRMVGDTGLYETPSEYVRDLAAGRMFESSGDFKTDMALLDQNEASGWQ